MADGSRHGLYIVEEEQSGVTPATPTWSSIRHTATTLGLSKESLQSEELRSDRQIADFRQGANQVGGDISIELSYGSFDQILEAVLCGDWMSQKTTTANMYRGQITLTDQTIVLVEGSEVLISGFTNEGNNGLFEVLSDDAPGLFTLTPLEGQIFVEENDATINIEYKDSTGNILKAGVNRRSFTIERHFSDMASANKPYHRFTGVEFNTLALNISANSMLTGTLSILGRGMTVNESPVTGSVYQRPTTTEAMDSFTGALYEGGQIISVVTEVQLTLENSLEARFVVGQKDSIDPSIGRSNCTGQVVAYFENSLLLDKFINEQDSSLTINLPDKQGNQIIITIPNLVYTGGQPDVSGEGPITLTMPFQAKLDPVTKTNIIIERKPA